MNFKDNGFNKNDNYNMRKSFGVILRGFFNLFN